MAGRRGKYISSKGNKTVRASLPQQTRPIRRKKKESFSLYIYKVLKDTAGNKEPRGINKKAMKIMNSMVFDVFDQIALQSSQLIR